MNSLPVVVFVAFYMLVDLSSALITCGRNHCHDEVGKQCRIRGPNNAWNETLNHGYIVTKWCRIANRVKEIRVIRGMCPSPGGLLRNSKRWKNDTSCYEYICKLIRKDKVNYQLYLRQRSFGCPFNGKCVGRGKKWNEVTKDFNIVYRCKHNWEIRLPPRLLSFEITSPCVRVTSPTAECAWGDRLIRMGSKEILKNGTTCESYNCPSLRQVRKSGVLQLNRVNQECYYDGQCRASGAANQWNKTLEHGYMVTMQCNIGKNFKEIVKTKYYCPAKDGYKKEGETWDDHDDCNRYKCVHTTTNGTTTFSKEDEPLGCHYDGQCRLSGAANQWNKTLGHGYIATMQCNIRGNMKEVVHTQYYCPAKSGYKKEGESWDDLDHCNRYTCTHTTTNGKTTFSKKSELIGCNLSTGCILDGTTANVTQSGHTFKVACTLKDGKPSISYPK